MDDLDTINRDGLTALYISLMTSGQEKLSLLLIECGARLLISKPNFQLALHVEQIAGRAASSCSIHETSGPDIRIHEISIYSELVEVQWVRDRKNEMADPSDLPSVFDRHSVSTVRTPIQHFGPLKVDYVFGLRQEYLTTPS